MSEQPEDGSKPDETQNKGASDGEGIELTMAAPNSFEPEEDPDAVDDEADA